MNKSSKKRRIIPGEIPTKNLHQYLLGSVSPRPIALVSTIDKDGNNNLAPYSFFNAFSSNPPIVVFSSNRKVTDNTTKDTLHNILQVKECVISAVSYDIMRQMVLSSVAFPSEISEFEKTGLTPSKSETVAVPGVVESPVNMECKVKEIITLGTHGGAGHLIVCEIQMMHVSEAVLDGDKIDPHKIDLIGRMGRTYYVRASGNAVFSQYQNIMDNPIGYENLPNIAKSSKILTGNDIGHLAALSTMPSAEEIINVSKDILSSSNIEQYCADLIANKKIHEALTILLAANNTKL
ncbi:MAG: flavin reductase family protein [Saprospiraceae bacterium]